MHYNNIEKEIIFSKKVYEDIKYCIKDLKNRLHTK